MSASSPPDMTTVGADLYAAVEPLTYADAELGYPLANYLAAVGLILEEVAQLVRADDEGNDGWSAFADPQRCPDSYLYTLAQWAGVRYPRRVTPDDLRELIGPHAPGLWRGTRAAIEASIARYLTPGGTIYFEERADGDAYKLRIFTYTHDTLDQSAIADELAGAVPAGLILDYEVRDGQTYGQLAAHNATYAVAKAKYATYADMTGSLPG